MINDLSIIVCHIIVHGLIPVGKSTLQFEFIESVDALSKSIWETIDQNKDLFCSYSFLAALEHSQSVGEQTGWSPFHLVAYQEDEVVGILPLYKKSHSYGEYVFDFAWADAYERHQRDYYPKLINAIPFTPVSGNRCLVSSEVDTTVILKQMFGYIREQLPLLGLSSIHCLFPTINTSQSLSESGLPARKSVQFHWYNRNYKDFTDFLSHFTARRRKSVKKERQKIDDQGICIRRFHGESLTQTEMNFFYLCYCQTYLKRSGHTGYLTKAFFENIIVNMRDNLLIVIASRNNEPIAGALYFFDDNHLFGRYWGALQQVDALHFECCYYQGIEFCIEKNLKVFNPGTQGEHKILRGFEPTYCYSNHFLTEPSFHNAIQRFIQQEIPGIDAYKLSADKVLPFKQTE